MMKLKDILYYISTIWILILSILFYFNNRTTTDQVDCVCVWIKMFCNNNYYSATTITTATTTTTTTTTTTMTITTNTIYCNNKDDLEFLTLWWRLLRILENIFHAVESFSIKSRYSELWTFCRIYIIKFTYDNNFNTSPIYFTINSMTSLYKQ